MAKKTVKKNKLTPKQKAFCREYIIDFNGTQAAIRAGYAEKSSRVTAARMLTKANIQKEINRLIDIVLGAQREQIRYRVLKELQAIAYNNATDYINIETIDTVDNDGNKIQIQHVTIKDTDKKTGAVIASIKENEKGVIELKFHDKIKALELLGKYGSLFNDKLEISGPEGGPLEIKDYSKLTEEEAKELFHKTKDDIGKDK